MDFLPGKGAKTRQVENAIARQPGAFSAAEIVACCPGVSRELIRAVLKRLRKEGAAECLGRGPARAGEKG